MASSPSDTAARATRGPRLPRRSLRWVFRAVVRPVYVGVREGVSRLVFERPRGLVTEAELGVEEIGISGPHRHHYRPAGWLLLRRVLPRREVSPDDVFVDYGSGMGRVVFLAAADYPFRRVIGIELSEQLNEIARRNVERNRDRLRCRDVEILTVDALEYELPPDVTVAFFNNPFGDELFSAVIERLIAQVDRHPRPLRLIYNNPIEHEHLMATGRFRPVRRLRGWRPGREWSRSNSCRMYELVPADADPREAGVRDVLNRSSVGDLAERRLVALSRRNTAGAR